MSSRVRPAAAAALLAAAALWGLAAHAQVYRIVGPDGKVTFSDRPPPDTKAVPAQTVAIPGGGGGGAAGNVALPSELRRVVGQYPATLYSTKDCAPCNSARNYLLQRGIPFTEYTVNTRDDFSALQRLSGGTSLPFLTIGGQHVPGFSEAEWTQYFDAAGYPKTSQLPANYRPADASPLVAVQRAVPPSAPARGTAAAQPQRAEASPPVLEGPSPSNPAGIRF